jgi:hypothetical protein
MLSEEIGLEVYKSGSLEVRREAGLEGIKRREGAVEGRWHVFNVREVVKQPHVAPEDNVGLPSKHFS